MKKTVLALVLMGFASQFSVALYAQAGVIRELSGTVELKGAGQASFTAARVGDRVNQDTVISTALKSSALVEVGSTLITVRALTRLTLTEIQAAGGEEKLNVNLQSGRVRVDVNPPAGTKTSMTVSSPNATASVRGTSFYFDTQNLSVEQGTVLFKGNRGYTIQAGAGSSTLIAADSRASAPQYSGGNQSSNPVVVVGLDSSSRDTAAPVVTAPVRPAPPTTEPPTTSPPTTSPTPPPPWANGPSGPSGPSSPNEPGEPDWPSGPSGPSTPGTPSGTGGIDITYPGP